MNKKLLIINTFPREDTEESIMDESMGARWTEWIKYSNWHTGGTFRF